MVILFLNCTQSVVSKFEEFRKIDYLHSIHIKTPCNLQQEAFNFSHFHDTIDVFKYDLLLATGDWYHNPLICFT